MEPIAYINGELLPISEARISVLDNGFLFGYGFFLGMRIYNGKVFRLDKYINRAKDAIEKLGIMADINLFEPAIMDTIEANGLEEGQVRITVSPGKGTLLPDPRDCTQPTVVITAMEYNPHSQVIDSLHTGER